MGMASWLSSPEGEPVEGGVAAAASSVERDVESPDVFNVTDGALWDGRPSLGGVWVAHPDVADPERVIIRNEANGQSVIGALFRRERDNPGPTIQVSSDAADALGMLAGQPADLSVVALRREQTPVAPVLGEPVLDADPADPAATDPLIAAAPLEPITTTSLDGTTPEADALPPLSDATASAATAAAPVAPAPLPATTTATTTLDKPFIQIGIFSVEENAANTATSLRNIGIIPSVLEQESQGKTFWRVVVGPAFSRDEQRVVLGQVRELGFDDAFYVTN
ncbi:MAG: SPOR domain-containing protein, partial [Pseudomonadota bacterium]